MATLNASKVYRRIKRDMKGLEISTQGKIESAQADNKIEIDNLKKTIVSLETTVNLLTKSK